MRVLRPCVLAFAALAAACTALQPPQPDSMSLHVLTAAPLPKSMRAPHDSVVEVAQPRAWPGFDTPQMAYVRKPYELEYFATSRWVDTPSRMMAPLIARALEQTGSFRTIVALPSSVPAAYRLDTEIVRLQQDFAVRPSTVEVTVRAQLTDVRTKHVIASRVFEEVATAPSENAAGGVAATNAALQRILERIAEFCAVEISGP